LRSARRRLASKPPRVGGLTPGAGLAVGSLAAGIAAQFSTKPSVIVFAALAFAMVLSGLIVPR
jgi:hypothetical protein